MLTISVLYRNHYIRFPLEDGLLEPFVLKPKWDDLHPAS